MNLARVDAIVRAVLYEGYMLYPYRPSSVKNRQRWTFGGIYPRDYEAVDKSSAANMRTQCLLRDDGGAAVEVHVRFLHLLKRDVGKLTEPAMELPAEAEPAFLKVPSLQVGERRFQEWEETVERDVTASALSAASLSERPVRIPFSFPANAFWNRFAKRTVLSSEHSFAAALPLKAKSSSPPRRWCLQHSG